jgi:hypothetical protein
MLKTAQRGWRETPSVMLVAHRRFIRFRFVASALSTRWHRGSIDIQAAVP